MYNGIGLNTPRGSGTSGYVQKSLAFVKPRQVIHNYKEVLEKFKENPAPTKKKANSEIIEHEMKHKIEVQLFNYMEDLKEKKLNEAEIHILVNKKREDLCSNLNNLSHNSDAVNSHAKSKLKDAQMEKIKDALNIRQDYEHGTAFDVELQEEKKQKRLLEIKEEKRRQKNEMKKAEKEERKREKERLKRLKSAERKEKEDKTKELPSDKTTNITLSNANEKDVNKLNEKKLEIPKAIEAPAKIENKSTKIDDKIVSIKSNEGVIKEDLKSKSEKTEKSEKENISKSHRRDSRKKSESRYRSRSRNRRSRSRSRSRSRDTRYKNSKRRDSSKKDREDGELRPRDRDYYRSKKDRKYSDNSKDKDRKYNRRTRDRDRKESEKKYNHKKRSPSSSSSKSSKSSKSKRRDRSSSSSSSGSSSSSSFYN